jgi:hypothetical protein
MRCLRPQEPRCGEVLRGVRDGFDAGLFPLWRIAATRASIEAIGGRSYQPFVDLERAKLARRAGDHAAAVGELREAHGLFTEIGATAQVEWIAREVGC